MAFITKQQPLRISRIIDSLVCKSSAIFGLEHMTNCSLSLVYISSNERIITFTNLTSIVKNSQELRCQFQMFVRTT